MAVHECIRLSQAASDADCLEHALVLMQSRNFNQVFVRSVCRVGCMP